MARTSESDLTKEGILKKPLINYLEDQIGVEASKHVKKRLLKYKREVLKKFDEKKDNERLSFDDINEHTSLKIHLKDFELLYIGLSKIPI